MDSVRMIASLLCPALILITVGYAAVCVASPFGTCRRCSGLGRFDLGRGRKAPFCKRCAATGIRIRFGRHLYNEFARIYRDGTR